MLRFLAIVMIGFFVFSLALVHPSFASREIFEPYRERGIVVAQESDMAPMSFVGHDGEPKGFIIDLWRKWSAETGVPVRFYLVDWADTLTAVRDGKADVHGGLFFTDSRDTFLDYSLPFFPTKGGLFVKKGSPIRSFSQLNGKRVGVISKSFFDNYVRKNLPEVESVPIKTSAELVIAADQGNVDAFVADYPTLMYQSGIMGKRNSFEVVEYAADQEYRAAVAEGNTPMLVMVESGLSLIDDSERQTILSRWIIGEDEDSMDWLMPVIFLTGCSVFIALLVPFLFSIQRRRKS